MAEPLDTLGIEQDGYADPSKQFPRRSYENVPTTNLAATGAKRNILYLGGGDQGIDLDLNIPTTSKYPLNDVRETVSGHITEVDDTPGSERILFRHKTGAGIEMRTDGTVIITSRKNTIRVSGGDEKVIVEGDGEVSYNGNLTLNVAGDFDVRVGGNYKVHVSGDEEKDVRGTYVEQVHRNHQSTVRKNKSQYILGTDTETIYGDQNSIIRGNIRQYAEGNIDQFSGETLTMTAEKEVILTAPNMNIGAQSLTVIGDSGTIGGENIIGYDYNHYTGHSLTATDTISTNTAIITERTTCTEFVGSLTGKASFAAKADQAGSAPLGPGSGGGTQQTGTPTAVDPRATVLPTAPIMDDYINKSSKGSRKVSVDQGDIMKNQIDKTVDYGGVSARRLTTPEIRSKLRDPTTLANKKFVGAQIAEGKLSASYINAVPPAIGRKVGKESTPRRGNTPIGNLSRGRTKRFSL